MMVVFNDQNEDGIIMTEQRTLTVSRMQKKLVVKGNGLIEASYRLDLSAQRLVLLAVINARDTGAVITPESYIDVSARDYIDAFNLSRTAGYKTLKAAADALLKGMITLSCVNERTGKPGVEKVRWVSSCQYYESEAFVRVQFTPAVIPNISNLESRFSSYLLKNVSKITSSYTIRMYELLAQYKTIGIRDISLVDLRGFLGADDPSYDRLDNFKRKVLDLGVKQINELTDLDVSYVPERSGRSIIGYKFKIQTKPQDQLIKIAGPKPKAKKAAPAIPTGLTLAEKNMIKKICIKSGQSEDDVLANAQAMNVELFIALDRMIKAV